MARTPLRVVVHVHSGLRRLGGFGQASQSTSGSRRARLSLGASRIRRFLESPGKGVVKCSPAQLLLARRQYHILKGRAY